MYHNNDENTDKDTVDDDGGDDRCNRLAYFLQLLSLIIESARDIVRWCYRQKYFEENHEL